jgi:mannitol/fructose-specific phosphotransferase system IIA component (Ntr-type)
MKGISKETLLKAEDSKNRDAILFDMLDCIDEKLDCVRYLKDRIEKVEKKISYIKGVGTAITIVLTMLMAWLAKVTGGQ